MAGVQPQAQGKGGKTALGLRKRKRVGIGIDMTPMVDVAFLLLIFFMVTTVFRRPLAMEVNMPKPGEKVEVKESNVMTLYVREDGSMVYDIGRQGFNPVTWDELREVLVLEGDYNPELIVLAKMAREAKYSRFFLYSSSPIACGVMFLIDSMPSTAPQSACSMMALESRWKTSRTVRPAYALTSAVVTPHPAACCTVTAGLPTSPVMPLSRNSHRRLGSVPSEFWISTQAWSL